MPDTLDPIVDDKLAAGGILAALKLARQCLADPDWIAGRPFTRLSFFRAWRMVRDQIWDAVDDCADVNRSNEHADAVIEALGLTGVLDRVSAIEHHRIVRSGGDGEIVDVVDRQLTGAITRLTAALAESQSSSN